MKSINSKYFSLMRCPICNTTLLDDDDKSIHHVASFFVKNINPISLIKTCVNVARTIYYDFSNIKQTDEYLYCPYCKLYFIKCCHCGHINCIGNDIMVSPKKITCSQCHQEYVYATHPDPDIPHETYI